MKKYFERNGVSVPFGTRDPYLSSAFLGSTGPDIFYIGAGQKHISDFHHYKNAGFFVKNLYEQSGGKKSYGAALSLGFLCHMATDLVIHPFVNSLVGKYQEHIVTRIEIPGSPIPGGSPTLSQDFVAHNMVEFAQDYYVHTHIFKNNSTFKAHKSIFTYGIKPIRNELTDLLYITIQKTYGLNVTKSEINEILGVFMNYNNLGSGSGNKIQNIEDHVDYVLDDEYKNYQIFLQHQKEISGILDNENSTFMKLVDKAVEVTELMVADMLSGNWDDITRPWNLDTGLYTEPKVENNEIKISFKKYENIWG